MRETALKGNHGITAVLRLQIGMYFPLLKERGFRLEGFFNELIKKARCFNIGG